MDITLGNITISNYPAQISGIFAAVFLIIAYFKPKKLEYLLWSYGSFVFFIIESIFLFVFSDQNTISNIICNIVCALRNTIMLVFLLKFKKETPWWTGLVTIVILGMVSLPFLKEWYTYIPLTITSIFTISLLFKNYYVGKIGSIILEGGYLLYCFIVGAYSGIIRQSILLVFIIVSIIKMVLNDLKNKKVVKEEN